MIVKKQICPDCEQETWLMENRPSKIIMNGLEIIQKARKFYVIAASARDLDLLCEVPVLETDLDNYRLAIMALGRGIDKWQRELSSARVGDIGKFFDSDRNYFVNATVISLPFEEGTERLQVSRGLATFSIPVDWMKQRCPACNHEEILSVNGRRVTLWFDHCPSHGCRNHRKEVRPGTIIDGQHRIRGTQSTYCTGSKPKEKLVAAVLPRDFTKHESAKIFTEITTGAEDLEPLHKIFLLYKFGLRASTIQQIKEADFRTRSKLGKRNRRAYEIACTLCSDSGSPWYDRITILRSKNRIRRGDVIEITQIVPILEKWLRSRGVFQTAGGMISLVDAVEQLDDYLKSVINTWSGPTYWNPGRGSNGVFQDKGIFYVILRLFENFAKRIDARAAQRSRQEFHRELTLLSTINWDSNWQRMRAPERDRNLLYRILSDKVDNAPSATHSSFASLPGLNAYIRRKPEKFDWSPATKRLKSVSLSRNIPLTFEWNAPLNAYETCSFYILQSSDVKYEDYLKRKKVKIDTVPAGLDTSPSAPDVIVKVRYYNHTNMETDLDLKMKP